MQVTKPLYKLISGENAARNQNLMKWEAECHEAFDKCKELCTSTPTEQLLGKIPVFIIKSREGDDKMKVVHRNLLLLLFSDPSDHTSESDTKSVVDQTVSTHEVIAAGVVTSHVQNMSAYSRAWVVNMFQQGLEFVTALYE